MEVALVTTQEDRRRYHRIENDFNVRIAREIKSNEFKDMVIDTAKSINISASGLSMHLKERLEPRELVRVTFLKPNTFEFFEGLARVVRVEEKKEETYTVALHFFNLSTTEMSNLDYYLGLCKK
jgi:c-di-GMP-binding flagellar brake protein YcgR